MTNWNFFFIISKSKLEIITGGNSATMQLELFNGDKFISKLTNNDSMIGSYPIEDGMRIHVIDNFLFMADSVEKFELNDQQYEQKQDSVRSFLKRNKLGKYNAAEMEELAEKKRQTAEEEKQKAMLCAVGSRCKVLKQVNKIYKLTLKQCM